MESALGLHRFHFAFTVTFHYVFAQLSMGLALLIFILKTLGLRTGRDHYDRAARFWIRIFAITFAIGVVTGIPMEFQFGTNWSRFARAAGGVIGQTLAMEGVFAFFLESTFVGLLLFGEKRLSRKAHWAVSLLLWLGTWLSGYFILATNAWMQHPVGYTLQPGGQAQLESLWALLLNPLAGLDVPAQPVRHGGDGGFRDGLDRRLLLAYRQARRVRAHLRPPGRPCSGRGQHPDAVSNGRHAGPEHRPPPARNAGRDGGFVRDPRRVRRWPSWVSPTWRNSASTIRSTSPVC
jgi:hypothetical protein